MTHKTGARKHIVKGLLGMLRVDVQCSEASTTECLEAMYNLMLFLRKNAGLKFPVKRLHALHDQMAALFKEALKRNEDETCLTCPPSRKRKRRT